MDARLTEIGNALEHWRGGKMAAGMEYGALLDGIVRIAGLSSKAYPIDIDAQLLFEDVDLLVERQLLTAEDPGTAKGGAAYHDGIDAVAVEGGVGLI